MSGVFYIGLGDRFGGSNVVQRKTDKALWIPMHPELVDVLEATQRRGEFVVLTQHGRPFSVKALGMRMQAWARAAGLPPGHTLHGLRKSLGKMLAESGATTRQIMAILGHDDITHAELYTREAEQRQLATDGTNKLTSVKAESALAFPRGPCRKRRYCPVPRFPPAAQRH
jgi:integrase